MLTSLKAKWNLFWGMYYCCPIITVDLEGVLSILIFSILLFFKVQIILLFQIEYISDETPKVGKQVGLCQLGRTISQTWFKPLVCCDFFLTFKKSACGKYLCSVFDMTSVLLYTFCNTGKLSYIYLICFKMWRWYSKLAFSSFSESTNSTEIEPGASLCLRKACDNDSEDSKGDF